MVQNLFPEILACSRIITCESILNRTFGPNFSQISWRLYTLITACQDDQTINLDFWVWKSKAYHLVHYYCSYTTSTLSFRAKITRAGHLIVQKLDVTVIILRKIQVDFLDFQTYLCWPRSIDLPPTQCYIRRSLSIREFLTPGRAHRFPSPTCWSSRKKYRAGGPTPRAYAYPRNSLYTTQEEARVYREKRSICGSASGLGRNLYGGSYDCAQARRERWLRASGFQVPYVGYLPRHLQGHV